MCYKVQQSLGLKMIYWIYKKPQRIKHSYTDQSFSNLLEK